MLPWSGGWLDWDFHETKVQEWIEDWMEDIKKDNERRESARKNAQTFFSVPG